MKPQRPVTATQVAAAAGVSLATLDRVLNKRAGVKPATAETVLDAVVRLGYRRDRLAASLARSRHYHFGFLLPDLPRNAFMQILRREIEDAAGRLRDDRISIDVVRYTAFDPVAAADQLAKLKQRGVMGVAVVAVDAPEVRLAIEELTKAGIAVVTLISDVTPSARACCIGIDNIAAGRVAGSLMGRFLGQRTGSVLPIAGRMTLRDHAERQLGFAQVMAREHPAQRVLATVEGLDDGQVAGPLVTAALEAHPDLIGIYSMGAGNRGVVGALERAGRDRDLVVIGHELTPAMRAALLAGVFDAAICQNPRDATARAVETLTTLVDGEAVVAVERLRIDITLKDNLPPVG
jgi:LacI family transcriptional regulator